jgi:hypothetical protein
MPILAMKTAKTPILVSLLGTLFCAAAVGAAPPVESFISPGHLFPVEGTAFLLPNGIESGSYRPLPAYDKPGGRVIGEVALVNPHCVTANPPADCEQGLTWELRLKSGQTAALDTAEYSYETRALVSYGLSIDAPNGVAWSPIPYAQGTFWVSTAKPDVHRFEDLVTFVEELEQWCTVPGKCAAPSAEMTRELGRLTSGELVLLSVAPAYNVTGIVTREGQRYYRLELPDLDPRSPPTSLPKVGYTPVRNKAGGHSGTFSPRGC